MIGLIQQEELGFISVPFKQSGFAIAKAMNVECFEAEQLSTRYVDRFYRPIAKFQTENSLDQ